MSERIHLTSRAVSLALAMTAIGCDDGAPPAVPELQAAAVQGAFDLSVTVRSLDGAGGSVRLVDDATGATLGGCDGVCVLPVAAGSRVRLVATPAVGSVFIGWHGVCWSAAADACVVTLDWHLAAGAGFQTAPPTAPPTWDLTLIPESADGLGAGGVRVLDPRGIELGACAGGRCVVSVPRGERVRLIANPELGSKHAAWRNVCYGASREDCYLTMDWHKAVHVAFVADPHRGEATQERVARELAAARTYLAAERADSPTRLVLSAPFAARVERDGESDQSPRVRLALEGRRERTIELGGRDIATIAAVSALRRARDASYQRKLYRALYDEAKTLSVEVAGRFSDPDRLPADPIVIQDAMGKLSSFIQGGISVAQPLELDLVRVRACLTGDPLAAVGTGNNGDLAALTASELESCGPSPDGLLMAYDWFPKSSLTCVKSQGARGSCTAFAVTSATEAALHQRYGQLLNLSEQHIYGINAGSNFTASEGELVSVYFERLAEYPGWFRFEHESQWNYNQSPYRERLTAAEYDAQETYPKYFFRHSCTGYFGTCSDNVAQGVVTCSNPDAVGSCSVAFPPLAGPQYRFVTEPYELWNADDLDGTMAQVKARLVLEHQLVVSMALPQTFGESMDDGFLAPPIDDAILGYHAMHVVGYVSNAVLGEALPDAPPGAGGGYFIVKNSWGPCFGDSGYVYISAKVMRDRAYSMMSFTRFQVEQAP